MLSADGLLSLFDNQFQNVAWRKQLPVNELESYKVRNMGRNLIAYSDERALMINSSGHIAFEVALPGDGKSVMEFFQLANGDVYSVFVRGEKCTVFKEHLMVG